MAQNRDQSEYEEVFTETDYYDGPRQGIANYRGEPHFYDCCFSDEKQDYINRYQLTPVSNEVFQLALEDWAIWKRWERAFKSGNTTQETHPALPEDRTRHQEIESFLAVHLRTDLEQAIVRSATFLILKAQEQEAGTRTNLLVKWSEPIVNSGDRIWADDVASR
jgi:hypothetical protein